MTRNLGFTNEIITFLFTSEIDMENTIEAVAE